MDAPPGDEEKERELLQAMEPEPHEKEWLVGIVDDDALRDRLLFGLLRATHEVPVRVSTLMSESDSSTGCIERIITADFLDAVITREGEGEGSIFMLHCSTKPELDTTYRGDQITDRLCEYFNKGVLKFADEACMSAAPSPQPSSPSSPSSPSQSPPTTSHDDEVDEIPNNADEITMETAMAPKGGADSSAQRQKERNEDHSVQGPLPPPGPGCTTSLRSRNELRPGIRINFPREAGCHSATVAHVVDGGTAMLVFDDMFWAGYRTEDLREAESKGDITYIATDDDVPNCDRIAMLLSPSKGSPPDCFLYDEQALEMSPKLGWRWFARLVPAPENNTFGQKYSTPRLQCEIKTGMHVTLSGRVVRLIPAKRKEVKPHLYTSTVFTLLGLLQATLTSQRCYWVALQLGSKCDESSVYMASLFDKDGGAHITPLNTFDDEIIYSRAWFTKVQSMLETRLPAQTNSLLANQKPLAEQVKEVPRESSHDQQEQRVASDPFEGKWELAGVGRSRLLQCTKAELMAICRSRGVSHVNHLEVGKIVAKLEAWKRECSRTRRGNIPNEDDDFPSGHEEIEETPVEDVEPRHAEATSAKERGRRGETRPTTGGEDTRPKPTTTPIDTDRLQKSTSPCKGANQAPMKGSSQRGKHSSSRSSSCNAQARPHDNHTRGQQGREHGGAKSLNDRHARDGREGRQQGIQRDEGTSTNDQLCPKRQLNDLSSSSSRSSSRSSSQDRKRRKQKHKHHHRSNWHGRKRHRHDRPYSHSHSRQRSCSRTRRSRSPSDSCESHRSRTTSGHNQNIRYGVDSTFNRRSRTLNYQYSLGHDRQIYRRSHNRERHRHEAHADHDHSDRSNHHNHNRYDLEDNTHGKMTNKSTSLPPGWKRANDERGRTYYYSKSLGVTQFEPPSPPLPPPDRRSIVSPTPRDPRKSYVTEHSTPLMVSSLRQTVAGVRARATREPENTLVAQQLAELQHELGRLERRHGLS